MGSSFLSMPFEIFEDYSHQNLHSSAEAFKCLLCLEVATDSDSLGVRVKRSVVVQHSS